MTQAEWDLKYENPRWVYEGQKVIAPYRGTTGIRCVVTCAAGNHARVENVNLAFCKWFPLDRLIVEKGDLAKAATR